MCTKTIEISKNEAMQINPNLAVILAHNMDGWFYERYVNIFMYQNIVDYIDNVNYAGLIKQYKEYSYDAALQKGIIKIIEEEIGNHTTDCFLHIWVDEFELPCSMRYKNYHFVHPLMIYGFDSDKRVFNSIFFDINKGQVPVDIKYDDFNKAVFNVGKYYSYGGTDNAIHTTICCCSHEKTLKGVFHLDVFIKQLKNYMCSCNDPINEWYTLSRPGLYDDSDIVFGINVYLRLIAKLKRFVSGQETVPYKSIHDFVRSKKYLLDRLVYIQDNYEVGDYFCILVQKWEKIYKCLENVRLLNMKIQIRKGFHPASLCRDDEYIRKLISVLEAEYNTEKILIPKIINSLTLLKYKKGYLSRHHVINMTSPAINTKEKYLEFNLEQPKEAYKIDIVRNSPYKYISEPEYILVNDNMSYYTESDNQYNSAVRTVNILCDTIKNIKLYTDINNADYSINIFCMRSICEHEGVAELKINEGCCSFHQVANIHYNNGFIFDVTDRDPYITWNKCNINADIFKYIHIKMSVTADSQMGQIFFTTKDSQNFCIENSINIEIDNSGNMKSYYIDMSQNENWHGMIPLLRFDPLHYTREFNWDSSVKRTCCIETVEIMREIP